MSLAGCRINLVDVNFHPQKGLETIDKNSAYKIWSCQLGLKYRLFNETFGQTIANQLRMEFSNSALKVEIVIILTQSKHKF